MFDYYASLHAGPRSEAVRVARNEARSFTTFQVLRSMARPLSKAREWYADQRRELTRRRDARETADVLAQLSDRGLADIGISRNEIWQMSEAASLRFGASVAQIRDHMVDNERAESTEAGVAVPEQRLVVVKRGDELPQVREPWRTTRERNGLSAIRSFGFPLDDRAAACCG